jgi:nucleoid-associated protein YgaU
VVETVEAEANGRKIFVTGHTMPGALVRLYVNDAYQATATADQNGRVAFTAASGGSGRNYQVRLDEVDWASGVTKSRAEVPFAAPQGAAVAAVPDTGSTRVAQGQTMVVSRGDSLWRISRRALGNGTRYATVFRANREQIRNPNLIYPGQVFVVPAGEARP